MNRKRAHRLASSSHRDRAWAPATITDIAMKLSTLALLGIMLTACGDDDAGLTDTGSTTGTTASTSSSGSEGADGDSTADGADTTDPTPILEREPMPTHACEETRAMTQAVGVMFGRSEALVTMAGEHFVLRSAETLTLASIGLDGAIGDEIVLEADEFLARSPTSVVVDAEIVTVWAYDNSVLRYAEVDEALTLVVAPRDIVGPTGEYVTVAAMVPSASDGVGLLYGESDGGGLTYLRFLPLDADGDAASLPVDVAQVGQTYGMVAAAAALTSDGGYAVTYTVGEYDETEVFFVILEADGTQRFAPQRISRAGVDGWRSELGSALRRSVLPVGDRFWVAFTESWFDPDPMVMAGNTVVKLAIVDAQGQSESHSLQAPIDGKNHLWPSFVEVDDRVGLMWTSGSIIYICGGCISDHDLKLVLLDPDAIVPASNVATQLHQTNGIVAPLVTGVGADLLTAASLDFHATSLPSSGTLRCEPTG
jgi:hypothetical protein